MKKGWIFLLVLLGLFAFSAGANSAIITGSWDTREGDFDSGGWTETFLGGGEGQAGNVIAAGGNHWSLGGKLSSAIEIGTDKYKTIYNNAYLYLNYDGPWWGTEEAEVLGYQSIPFGDITVTTTKTFDPSGDLTNLAFEVAGSGYITGYRETYGNVSSYPDLVSVTIAGGYSGLPDFQTNPFTGGIWGMGDSLDWATVKVSAVPEPATMLLLGAGLLGLGGLRRKFRK